METTSEAYGATGLRRFFSFEGRIRRQGYWIVGVLCLGILNFILYMILTAMASGANPNAFGMILIFLLMLALSISALSIQVRRWHDLDKSGWWTLIALIPFVGALIAFVMLGFMEGDQGHNQYGPAPEEGAFL